MNGWASFKFWFQILSFIDVSPTRFFKVFLTPYYSSSWDESCSTNYWTIFYLKIIDFFVFLLIILTKILKKNGFQNFQKFWFFVIFFASEWRSKSQFLPSLEPIDIKILPASIFFETSYPRKWIQIEIWTDEPTLNFDFKSLALPICRRPRFSKFP